MRNTLIKICGLRDIETARQTAQLGADFIGMIFDPTSRRYVDVTRAKLISVAIKEGGGIPVAVFVHHTAAQMREICEATDIQTVQLHGDLARQQHHLLSENYQRIYVQLVKSSGDIVPDQANGLRYCDIKRDFVLCDHEQRGQGVTFDWRGFNYQGEFRMFLAGGLTVENARAGIEQTKPAGVDVSGGVENQLGEKDITLIEKFIQKIIRINLDAS
jgi:phosphoribosylanthranilate isomerase